MKRNAREPITDPGTGIGHQGTGQGLSPALSADRSATLLPGP
jgi:hypothetical protein